MSDALLCDLAAHFAHLPPVQVRYTDLDGTLLGRTGRCSPLLTASPRPRAAAALVAARLAGVTVGPVSGRRAASLAVDARLMGLPDAIAEVGARHYEWGECPRSLAGDPREALRITGALGALLAAFDRDPRRWQPWDTDREGGCLLHGSIDAANAANAANAALQRAGRGWAA
ncbi:MAG: hypothetical protein ACRD0K_16210 [Egibacteraceae bacterium]